MNQTIEVTDEALKQLRDENAVDVLKDFIKATEDKKAAEKKLDKLKPLVESFRLGEKKKSFIGKLRNILGEFIITHVDSSQDYASVKVLRSWLENRLITQAMYDEAISTADKSYNLVRFTKGA